MTETVESVDGGGAIFCCTYGGFARLKVLTAALLLYLNDEELRLRCTQGDSGHKDSSRQN